MHGCPSGVTTKVGATGTRGTDKLKNTRPFERDRQREEQRRADRPDAPLHPKLERRVEERQSCKQRGGIFPRASAPRGRVALPHTCDATISCLPGRRSAHQCNKVTFETEGVKIEEETSGASKKAA